MAISYFGCRDDGPGSAVAVVVDGEVTSSLAPRNDLRNHSPDGFEWGYGGSGPAQLALALSAHALISVGDPFPIARALHIYQAVKEILIAPIQFDAWEITLPEVLAAIDAAERERGKLEIVSCEFHGTLYPVNAICPTCIEEERADEFNR